MKIVEKLKSKRGAETWKRGEEEEVGEKKTGSKRRIIRSLDSAVVL
jgi:hypothetical protein